MSTRSPSRVPVRMCALVSLPSGTLPFIVNVTRASPLCSDTSDTVPTLIPDTVTALPVAENSRLRRTTPGIGRRSPAAPDPIGRQAYQDEHPDYDGADESGFDQPSSAVFQHQCPPGSGSGSGSSHLFESSLYQGASTVLPDRSVPRISISQRKYGMVAPKTPSRFQLAIVPGRLLKRGIEAVLVVIEGGANLLSWSTVPDSGGLALPSRSASVVVPLLNASMAGPKVLRSFASPVTSRSRRSIAPENWPPSLFRVAGHGVQVVDQMLDRLVVVGQRIRE